MAEGEDKPLKYPLMFRACDLVIVNKIDLLPHLDFDLDRYLANLDAVHPGVERLLVSARTGEGTDELRDWLLRARRPGKPPRLERLGSTARSRFGSSSFSSRARARARRTSRTRRSRSRAAAA